MGDDPGSDHGKTNPNAHGKPRSARQPKPGAKLYRPGIEPGSLALRRAGFHYPTGINQKPSATTRQPKIKRARRQMPNAHCANNQTYSAPKASRARRQNPSVHAAKSQACQQLKARQHGNENPKAAQVHGAKSQYVHSAKSQACQQPESQNARRQMPSATAAKSPSMHSERKLVLAADGNPNAHAEKNPNEHGEQKPTHTGN